MGIRIDLNRASGEFGEAVFRPFLFRQKSGLGFAAYQAPSPCKGEGWDGGARRRGGVLASRWRSMYPRLRRPSHTIGFSSWTQGGCGPAAVEAVLRPFLVSPKEVTKERRPRRRCPFGGGAGNSDSMLSACGTVCACKRKLLLPKNGSPKREAHKLALRAQTYALLIRFADPFFGSVTGELLKTTATTTACLSLQGASTGTGTHSASNSAAAFAAQRDSL
jgi:hypothetical protein